MTPTRRPLGRLVDALLPTHSPTTQPTPSTVAGRWVVWLVALVAVGVAARFRFFLSRPSYWYDEAYLLLNVFGRSFRDLVGPLDHNVVVAPGFAWLERVAYLLLGPGEWALRLPPFLAGLAAVAVMVPLGRRVVGGWTWWLPVALIAVSRAAVRHGGEAKQYTFDLLGAAAAVLPAVVFVQARGAGRSGWWAFALVLVAAALGPWVAFPTAFAVGGACAALLVHACRTGKGGDWGAFAGVAGVAAASAAALWWFHARHLYYPGMIGHWGANGQGGFPDWDSRLSQFFWPVNCLIQAGRYGTREVGAVLLPLAVLGAVRLWRGNPAVAAAVVVPVFLAVAASCVGKYPLGNRTTVCVLPGLWLAASAGVREVAERFALRGAALILCAVLLVHGTADTAVSVVRPHAFPAAREALQDVRAARRPDDVVWVSHPEVDRLYHGREERVLGSFDPPERVVERAAGGRVWLVVYPCPFPARMPVDDLTDALRAAGYREVETRSHPGMVVALYAR